MSKMLQPVDGNNQFTGTLSKIFTMIDNYVYLYHTDTLIAIPTYPESIGDVMNSSFQQTPILSRSAPIYSYQNSGPRSFSITLHLHRDIMNQINVEQSNLRVEELQDEDYLDLFVRQLQSMALPKYAAAEKMVNPPLVAVRFSNDVFCKGVINGGVTVSYSGPILRTNRYAQVDVEFTINECDPYDAVSVTNMGSYRGLSTDLERRLWKTADSKSKRSVSGVI